MVMNKQLEALRTGPAYMKYDYIQGYIALSRSERHKAPDILKLGSNVF